MSIQPYNYTTPSPGWYPDPEGGPALRWFNGTERTYQYQAPTQQFAPPPPPAERRFTIHYGFALLALLSLAATLLFGIPMLASATDSDTQGVGVVMGVLWMLWGGMWTLIWTAFAIQHTLKARRA